MAGEDYGNTGASLLDQHVTHDIDRYGVKARKRFVQNEYRWVVNQRRCELHTLLITEGQGIDGVLDAFGDAQTFGPPLSGRVRVGLRESV